MPLGVRVLLEARAPSETLKHPREMPLASLLCGRAGARPGHRCVLRANNRCQRTRGCHASSPSFSTLAREVDALPVLSSLQTGVGWQRLGSRMQPLPLPCLSDVSAPPRPCHHLQPQLEERQLRGQPEVSTTRCFLGDGDFCSLSLHLLPFPFPLEPSEQAASRLYLPGNTGCSFARACSPRAESTMRSA